MTSSHNPLIAALEANVLNTWEIDYIQTATHPNINPENDDRPYVYAQIAGNNTLACLYDTGAQISVMSQHVFDTLINKNGTIELSAPAQLTVAKKTKDQTPVVMTARTCQVSFAILGQYTSAFPLRVSPDLSSQTGCIIGADLIHKLQLSYDATRKRVVAPGHSQLKPVQSISLPAFTTEIVECNIDALSPIPIDATNYISVYDSCPDSPIHVTPMMVEPSCGKVMAIVSNVTPQDMIIRNDEGLGRGQLVPREGIQSVDQLKSTAQTPPYVKTPVTPEKKKYLLDNIQFGDHLTSEQKRKLVDIVLLFHQAFGSHEYDIGVTTTFQHEIKMQHDRPIYKKQFRLADVHSEWLVQHVKKLVEAGVLRRSTSKYNSPVFCVKKPCGTKFRMVIDLREINKNMEGHWHPGVTVDELITKIGKWQPKFLSVVDTLKGFWGMTLTEESRKYTAFSLPSYGRFEFLSAPQGLLSSPAGYWQLMEIVLADLDNTLSYLDDVIVGSTSFDSHVTHLSAMLDRMAGHNLRLNPAKCQLALKSVTYLGFEITSEGVKPGRSKTEVIDKWGPPTTKKQIQAFVGLANYYRGHTELFQKHASQLTKLTKKDSKWTGGELPPDSLKAFHELKRILTTRPLLRFPDYSREFILAADAATGVADENGVVQGGGLGAVLTQIDEQGKEYAVGYASRGLLPYERNYPAFLLEHAALCFALDSFSHYVLGRKFRLLTDHRPLIALSSIHRRTLLRLQEKMGEYDFKLEYRPGEQNAPSDFASRALSAIESYPSDNVTGQDQYYAIFSYTANELRILQEADPICKEIITYLKGHKKVIHAQSKALAQLVMRCFMSPDHVVFYRPQAGDSKITESPILLFTPESIQHEIMTAAHYTPSWGGHKGVTATQDRILQVYFWPALLNDVANFVKRCLPCQETKGVGPRAHPSAKGPAPLMSYPQGDRPNLRINLDLFGPIWGDPTYKYCLTMICSFAKYVRLVPLRSKDAQEVATAFFNEWVCRFGCPIYIVSDQGKEFLSRFNFEMLSLLGITHLSSLPYRPQANGQVEKVHASVVRFLRVFIDEKRPRFSEWLPSLEFTINTATSQATKSSPFKLWYTYSCRYMAFDAEGVGDLFRGETDAYMLQERIKETQELAKKNNMDFRDSYMARFNDAREKHTFESGDLVMLHSPLQALRSQRRSRLPDLNFKLARPWVGPARVVHVDTKNPGVVIEFCPSSNIKGKFKAHSDRLKAYYLAQNEPDPFQHPRLHREWREKQHGILKESLPEEQPDQVRHPMRLRRRRGMPVEADEGDDVQALSPKTRKNEQLLTSSSESENENVPYDTLQDALIHHAELLGDDTTHGCGTSSWGHREALEQAAQTWDLEQGLRRPSQSKHVVQTGESQQQHQQTLPPSDARFEGANFETEQQVQKTTDSEMATRGAASTGDARSNTGCLVEHPPTVTLNTATRGTKDRAARALLGEHSSTTEPSGATKGDITTHTPYVHTRGGAPWLRLGPLNQNIGRTMRYFKRKLFKPAN